ncbi:DUF1622 domain-containing protein [Budviciaceae bacterium BWR-B9]|uniref:DUF1622 domain-containing protein n=1 Tax=Limnobaculum allomyrinae TaxID=2791986 RepID=A0ABS1IN64_9GAMM|nr:MULTISPECIES: DUF1622 domain-containing protein [Limnobaculum]MBK5142966.1 DUF1622 domain-containing protein [Limnobaculum allomyrinae]MBV7693295.1 DUF1622 domain-containing protein [Limnobaculum sp. M2-1]
MVDILYLINDILSAISILIIVYAVIAAVIGFIRSEIKREHQASNGLLAIRLPLCSRLLLGVEILIAVNILRTIMSPGYNELIALVSIVAVRTLLSLFIGRESKVLATIAPVPITEKITEQKADIAGNNKSETLKDENEPQNSDATAPEIK